MTVLETLDPNQQLLAGEPACLASLMAGHQQQQHQTHLHQQQQLIVQQHQHLHHLGGQQTNLLEVSAASLRSAHNNQDNDSSSERILAGPASGGKSAKRQRSGRPSYRQRAQQDGIIHPLHEGDGPIVRWLKEKYEIAEGESLPRSTVYNHYLAYCRYLNISSVNAASFGKLIRSVFVGLKTRRLGTRGHSKYHYFGVRATKNSDADLLMGADGAAGCSRDLAAAGHSENSNTDNGSESESTTGPASGDGMERLSSGSLAAKRISGQQLYELHGLADQQQQQQSGSEQQVDCNANNQPMFYYGDDGNGPSQHNISSNGYQIQQHHQQQQQPAKEPNNPNLPSDHQRMVTLEQQNQYDLADFKNHLGANWATLVDEHWPPANPQPQTGPANGPAELEFFEDKYKLYYKRMVELLSDLKFSEIKQLWHDFWRPAEPVDHQQQQPEEWALDHDHLMIQHHHQQHQQHHLQQQQQQHQQQHLVGYQQHNSFHQLYLLTSQQSVVARIEQIDYIIYTAIEAFLLPDMLSPIPCLLAQQISLFAKNIEPWTKLAIEGYPEHFVTRKTKSVESFGFSLRRYIHLNRLSTASRKIWEKRSTLARISIDLSRVDPRDIEHQVSFLNNNNSQFGTSHNSISLNLFSSSPAATATSSPTTTTITNSLAQDNNNPNNNENNNHQDNLPNHRLHHQHHLHQHLNTTTGNHNNSYQLCAMQPAQLIQNFLHLLEDPYPANSWPDWCRNLVESRVSGTSIEEARNFIFLWNFYISLIMKELILRSAPSYSSFHLIKLLFDDYIRYLVVTRLAQAHNKTRPN